MRAEVVVRRARKVVEISIAKKWDGAMDGADEVGWC